MTLTPALDHKVQQGPRLITATGNGFTIWVVYAFYAVPIITSVIPHEAQRNCDEAIRTFALLARHFSIYLHLTSGLSIKGGV